jgi:hypothetical protein
MLLPLQLSSSAEEETTPLCHCILRSQPSPECTEEHKEETDNSDGKKDNDDE